VSTKPTSPPRLAQKFLLWFVREELAEEVLGDLEEQFYRKLTSKSPARAKLIYWYQVLHYLRPFAITKSSFSHSNHTTMFRHNLLLSYRNILRHKSSFIINLVGLTTALTCALLIFLWIRDEVAINKFHTNDARMLQIIEHSQLASGITSLNSTPDFLAENMVADFPEIEAATGITPSGWFGFFTLKSEDKFYKATGQFAGSDFFKIFSYPLISGSKESILSDKLGVAISEDLAYKIFNTSENVIGKSIRVEVQGLSDIVSVTGVFENVPSQSTEKFDFILSWELWYEWSDRVGRNINWGNHGPETIVLLNETADPKQFSSKIHNYIKSKDENSHITMSAVPYSSLYLYNKFENGIQEGGRLVNIWLFGIIALFIMAVACINFMNLTTARAATRLKEVGVKKALGASKGNLVGQYLTESMLISLLAMLLSVALVAILAPIFGSITDKKLGLPLDSTFWLIILVVCIGTGLLAGSYPAVYLSRIKTLLAIKGGKLQASWSEIWVRKGLVVFQFTISMVLIVGVIVVYQQLDFIQSKGLGYEKENVIYFDKEGKTVDNLDAFLTEIRKLPGVMAASATQNIILGSNNSTVGLGWIGKNPEDLIRFEVLTVDYDLLPTLGIKLANGRDYNRAFAEEKSKIIFNEAAIKAMGLENPVGEQVDFWGEKREVIGVVENFHFETLHQAVNPLVIQLNPSNTMKIVVKIAPNATRSTLEAIEQTHDAFNPGYALNVHFLDQDYQKQYQAEQLISTLSAYFAGIAILISCLGLFGLASFTTARRTKEIGIRKILGAGKWRIIYMLTMDFTVMVVVAIVIAIPLSYFISTSWLQNFAYAISLSWWVFLAAAATGLLIAWTTMYLQTSKAASINPADCLRAE
jgi:putative ABC transport system permease protein